jgi:hypothetical protein
MDRAEYVERMVRLPQFQHFGISPAWRPGEKDVDGFVVDEVVRQFHDPRVPHDGGKRVRQMRAAWSYAQRASESRLPGVEDILRIGHYVEPELNSELFFRSENVYIGDSRGAPPRQVGMMIASLAVRLHQSLPLGAATMFPGEWRGLWESLEDPVMPGFFYMVSRISTVDDWYVAFEAVHPFSDGNGRSGKVLHNSLSGTLEDPVLVSDYFKGGNP